MLYRGNVSTRRGFGAAAQHALRLSTEFGICGRGGCVVELPEVERGVLEMLRDETNDIRRKALGELVLHDVAQVIERVLVLGAPTEIRGRVVANLDECEQVLLGRFPYRTAMVTVLLC